MLAKTKSNKIKSAKVQALKGFTLSEVMITLGIIGLVAAFGIPSLMRKTQDMEYKTAAKKAFSVSSQVVMQMKAQNGGSLQSYMGNWGSFKPDFMKYFKVLKDCGNEAGCVPQSSASDIYTSLHGEKADAGYAAQGQFVTADGMLYMIRNSSYAAVEIFVDVNGYENKPNVYGRDVFVFQIINDNLVPMGSLGSDFSGLCSRAWANPSQGLGCMVNVMNGIDY